MKTFNDLIDQQLHEDNLLSKIAAVSMDGAAAMGDKILGKVSKAARGRTQVRNIVKSLDEDFRSFCKDYSIQFKYAAVEDFLEFLSQRVGFNMPRDAFNKLAYGSASPEKAKSKEQIKALSAEIGKLLDSSSSAVDEIEQMVDLADDANNTAMVQKTLWGLARENPDDIGQFSIALRNNLLGRLIGSNYGNLINSIAEVIKKKSKALRRDSDVEGAPDAIDAGMRRLYTPDMFKRGEADDEMKAYEMSYQAIRGIYSKMHNKSDFDPANLERISKFLDRKMTKGQAINSSRILIQLFRVEKRRILDQLYSAYIADDGGDSSLFKSDVEYALLRLPIEKNQNDEEVYDASQFNNLLARHAKTEETSAKLFILCVYCAGRAGFL